MADTYFSYFGNIVINNVEIKNIFSKLKLNKIFENDTLFVDYRISDGDTPETLAYNLYDTKELFWIILITNNIVDYYYDWPLRAEELVALADKHTQELVNDVEADLNTGETLEEEFVELYGDTGETSSDYDTIIDRLTNDKYILIVAENELKREIQYLDPNYLIQFMVEVNKLKPITT